MDKIITVPFGYLLDWLYQLTDNFGIALLLFAVVVQAVMLPMTIKQKRTMMEQQRIQPMIQKIQKTYARDQRRMQEEMQNLYDREGVSPMAGCGTMLLTFPILIAMFNAMRMVSNEHLVQQAIDIVLGNEPVLESWLWIKNLWMPDSLFSPAYPDLGTMRQISAAEWLQWFRGLDQAHLPALLQGMGLTEAHFGNDQLAATIQSIQNALAVGNPAYAEALTVPQGMSINLLITQVNLVKDYNGLMLLPILSAVSQIAMTKLTGSQGPQQDQTQATTGKFMMWFFPIFSLVLCFSYSSAFALYWVASNLIAIVQNWAINKYLDAKEKKAAETIPVEGKIK